jgi:hypothetical protein
VVRKYAGALGLERAYSGHSMRATFITMALENGAQLEDVQKAAGHRDPSTTKPYDRRGYINEQGASRYEKVLLGKKSTRAVFIEDTASRPVVYAEATRYTGGVTYYTPRISQTALCASNF